MSCSFDVKKCLVCPKYNGCLLQMIYASVLNLTERLDTLANNQMVIADTVLKMQSNNNIVLDDSVDLSLDVSEINEKLDNIMKTLDDTNDSINELTIDSNTIKSSLVTLDLKVDDIIKTDYIISEGEINA